MDYPTRQRFEKLFQKIDKYGNYLTENLWKTIKLMMGKNILVDEDYVVLQQLELLSESAITVLTNPLNKKKASFLRDVSRDIKMMRDDAPSSPVKEVAMCMQMVLDPYSARLPNRQIQIDTACDVIEKWYMELTEHYSNTLNVTKLEFPNDTGIAFVEQFWKTPTSHHVQRIDVFPQCIWSYFQRRFAFFLECRSVAQAKMTGVLSCKSVCNTSDMLVLMDVSSRKRMVFNEQHNGYMYVEYESVCTDGVISDED